MSNALKTMVESSAHTLSDLVDEARSRIEDLPPIARPRQRRARKQVSSVALIAVVALVIAVVIRRSHRSQAAHSTDSMK